MNRIGFFLCCAAGQLLSLSVHAQEVLDSATLSQTRVYRSISEGLLQPDSVFRLNLSRQKRKEVPAEIRAFKNLQVLNLSKNNLRDLPEWIGEFQRLQYLDLSNNKLKELPPGIGQCRNLLFIGLNRNLIETLPREIGRLEFLEVLEMWDNEVQALPEEIKYLHNLKVLELRGILFSQAEQDQIRSLLPEAEIYFSPSCNCKN